MVRKLLIIVPVILALIVISLFMPAQRVSIEGIGRLSFETAVNLSVGQQEAYASPDIAFVNETHAYGASESTTIAAAAQNHTAGNLLVVIVCNYSNAAVSSIADTAGNTYTYAIQKDDGTNDTIEIWYAKNITGHASNVVTVTFTGSAQEREISVLQYSGADTSDPYDVSNTGEGSGTSQSTAASTTTYADEVIVAGYCESDDYTFTAGTNFTLRYPDGTYLGTEDRVVSSIGSYGSAITYSGSADYIAVHATFKAAAPDTEILRPEGVGNSTNLSQYPAIAVDAVSTGTGLTSPITVSHTTGSGTNRLMLVGISVFGSTITISSVTYNAVALSLVGTRVRADWTKMWIYQLVAPATGTYDLAVTFSAAPEDGAVVGVVTFTGVDQTTPLGTFAAGDAYGTTPSVDVSSASGELVFDTLSVDDAATVTVDASQAEQWNASAGSCRGAGSTEPGATTVTMSWSIASSQNWAIGAVPIKPVADGENWDKVDEETHDDNTTYVHADGVVIRDTYAMQDHSAGSGAINKVTTYFWAAREGMTYCGFNPVMRTHDTDYLASDQAINNTEPEYLEFSQEYTTNPNTGLAWTWAEVDAMEVGVENYHSSYGTGYLRVTQVYAVVDYTPPAPWLGDWCKRVKITIDHNDFDEDVTHFPVLIHLSTSSGREPDDVSFVFDEVGGNSKRIAVTKDDGTTELYVEIEKWDYTGTPSTSKAWLWVSRSGWTISSTVDTVIYLYYCNTQPENTTYVGDSGSRTEVWDSDFKGVWHLSETSGEIAVDKVSTNTGTGSTITVEHETSGTDRLMLVGIDGLGNSPEVSGVTYGGTPLTLVGRNQVATMEIIWIYRLVAPPTGTNDVVVSFSSVPNQGGVVGVMTFTGVDQTTPLGTFASNEGSGSGTASVNVSSAPGELVLDTVTSWGGLTVGEGQTQRWNLTSGDGRGAGSTEPGAASVTMSWSVGDDWAIGAVPIKPAAGILNVSVNASSDDARDEGGSFSTTSGNITAGQAYGDICKIGARWLNVTIPQGSTILSAYITVQCSWGDAGGTNVQTIIKGDAEDNCATFSTLADYNGRPRTTASVEWDITELWAYDSINDSPEIKTVIQEIVNLSGWASGNALALFWEDDGSADGNFRQIHAWDGASAKAPKLHIEYTTKVKDSTSNNNDGTDENSPTREATGEIDSAISFDGTNDRRINCGTDDSLNISSGTLEAWIYPEGWGPAGWGTIMDRGGSDDDWGYQFAVTDYGNGYKDVKIFGDGSWVGSGSNTISLDSWQHAVVVLTGSVAKFYVNGDAKDSPNWSIAAKVGTATFYIAWCAESAGEEFDGTIDEVRVSSTERTAAWIEASYESGRDDLLDFGTEETSGPQPDISNLPTSYDFGNVTDGQTYPTGLDYFTVTNNSGAPVDITIQGTDMQTSVGSLTPVVELWTVNDTGGETATSIDLTKPSGVNTDDLLLIIVGSDQSNTANWQALTGWTQFVNSNSTAADANLACYWRIADGTEGTTINVNNGATANELYGWYIRVSGVDTGDPINVLGTPQNDGFGTTSHVINSIDTTVDNCLAFYALAFDGGDTTYFNESDSGWAEVDEQWSGTASDEAAGCWGTKDIPSQGSTGNVTVTTSIGDGSSQVQFAIAPTVVTPYIWTLSDTCTPAEDVIGFKAGLAGGSYTIIVKKNGPYNDLVTGLADSASQGWGLDLYTPTNITQYGEQLSGTITLTGTLS